MGKLPDNVVPTSPSGQAGITIGNKRYQKLAYSPPAIGTLVTLGKTQGRVVRHLEQGFAVEFTRLQHPDFLEENVTGA